MQVIIKRVLGGYVVSYYSDLVEDQDRDPKINKDEIFTELPKAIKATEECFARALK